MVINYNKYFKKSSCLFNFMYYLCRINNKKIYILYGNQKHSREIIKFDSVNAY